ncbi:zinc-ribbon domain-containing protein [Halovivax gelatinilyticus]
MLYVSANETHTSRMKVLWECSGCGKTVNGAVNGDRCPYCRVDR